MLNSDKFRITMKILVVATKTSDFTSEDIQAYYEIMKYDFTDEELEKVCLAIAKSATFFPTVAEFYKYKTKPQIPSLETLISDWYESMRGVVREESRGWISQILNYYEGQRLSGNSFREMTETQWDFMKRDFGKAYNAFLKDYQAGLSLRIDYQQVPHITGSTQITGAKKISEILDPIALPGRTITYNKSPERN